MKPSFSGNGKAITFQLPIMNMKRDFERLSRQVHSEKKLYDVETTETGDPTEASCVE